MIRKILGLSQDEYNAFKYALSKRADGFCLLKNAKGDPPTQVNLIRQKFGKTVDAFRDEVTLTEKYSVNFHDGKSDMFYRSIETRQFIDSETGKPNKGKYILYTSFGDKADYIRKERNDLDIQQYGLRKHPKWSEDSFHNDAYSEINYINKSSAGRSYYKGFFESLISPFVPNDKRPTRPNFFKVFWENICKK